LIARQRSNLNRTFAQSEQPKIDVNTVRRLAKTQHELVAVTTEFTEGIEAIAGPIPVLHEAIEAMESAATNLDNRLVKPAKGFEEAAVAALIKARQNLRKLLSRESSSSSSARNFDRQQKQKLRLPKDDKEKQAKLQEEIEELAEQEKKFSEEVAGGSGSVQIENPDDPEKGEDAKKDAEKGQQQGQQKGEESKSQQSGSSPGQGKGKAEKSRMALAEQQERAAQKAEDLLKRVRDDEALTDLAAERMEAALKSIQASAQAMADSKDGESAKKAAEAAEELKRLAKQVAALKAAELSNRLASAQSMARDLAKKQEEMAKGLQEKDKGKNGNAKKAAEEQAQSEEAKTLADLMNRLQGDAAEANKDLGRALKQANDDNPPSAIAEMMRQAANALREGKGDQAGRDVGEAAKKLDDLAQRLDTARKVFLQPQLEKLMAAEKQAAETQKALHSVKNEQQKAEVEKKLTELSEAVDKLGEGDAKLQEAAKGLKDAMTQLSTTAGHGWPSPSLPKEKGEFYVPPKDYDNRVIDVIRVLQAKIQEVILKDALLDKDEAVPPQYKKLVEEYYRILSEDLR
jgi:hypothetical protein